MTNIDNIVKALRGCSQNKGCESCSFDCGGLDTTCIDNLESDAADAIEALQSENISLRAERDALLKAVEKPSVMERGD